MLLLLTAPSLIASNRLVLETLVPLPEDRKCFRLINGVLVERTVKDVVPALQTNAEGLKKVLDDLVKQYKAKQDELEKWKVCEAMISPPPPCSTRSDFLCRKRTTSRLCSHETGARVQNKTSDAMPSAGPGGVINLRRS
jgi:hypothetical protein